MKTQEKKPETVSRTLQRSEQKAHQPSAGAILQAYREGIVQRAIEDEEEPLQMKRANDTGLPDKLKSGIESLSGYNMDDVRVHYNSSQPAQFQALAYTQGSHIHVAPGQEKHLPHEAWHVVQQKQGRVQPTMQMKGINVNDDQNLEREADEMGGKANIIQAKSLNPTNSIYNSTDNIIQKRKIHIGKNALNYTRFSNRNYEDYNLSYELGHFDLFYSPSNKLLRIILPVYFSIPNSINHIPLSPFQKQLFKDEVESKWSYKHCLYTNATRYSNLLFKSNPWANLNPVRIIINVVESNLASSYFTVVGDNQETTSYVSKDLNNPNKGFVNLSLGGYYETLHNRYNVDTIDGHNTGYNKQLPVYVHESGHMLGLDDEYQISSPNYQSRIHREGFRGIDPTTNIKVVKTVCNVPFSYSGTNYRLIMVNGMRVLQKQENTLWTNYVGDALPGTLTTHYNLTEQALGERYAKKKAVMNNQTMNQSLMGAGSKIRKAHYVTFWDAFVNKIREVHPNQDNFPNQHEDWEIK